MKSFSFLVLSIILINTATIAQRLNHNQTVSDSVLKYYPLEIGNKWVYERSGFPWTTDYIAKEVLDYSILANGKWYFRINDEYERIDSANADVFRYLEHSNLPENEYVVTNLSAEIGETTSGNFFAYRPDRYAYPYYYGIFSEWGLNNPLKKYSVVDPNPDYSMSYSLTYDVGVTLESIDIAHFGYVNTILQGCVINGTVYGDTTVVSVDALEQHPQLFSLLQNYPNPFNPATTIKYQIPDLPAGRQGISFVTIKVYDVLGNEIATLVNEEIPAGSYEFEFSATGGSASGGDAYNLTSGIYFYQLRVYPAEGGAGNFVKTKKMVLIK